jgi:hypothetical protein
MAPADLQTSLDLVSNALTHTMTVEESQAWLNTRMPPGIDRAWFVTPEGVVSLSSITTANEISRSVINFVAIAQTWPATRTGKTLSSMVNGAALPGKEILTRAAVYSNTPLLLLVMVKQALMDLSPLPGEQVATQVVHHPNGAFAGIAAVSWRPITVNAVSTQTFLIAGLLLLLLPRIGWAVVSHSCARDRAR